MGAGTVRGADAREFVKAFNAICNWNNGWERWNDTMSLFAIEISNTVDLINREEREAEYIRIRQKYSEKEFERFQEVFQILIDSLERNPFQDFLGTMYMELDMGSKTHGQNFTPFGVCQAMANIAMPEAVIRERLEKRGWIAINDCACGAGATLIAAAERLYQLGINYQQKAMFVAGDIDTTVGKMCYVQLSLLGCPGRVRLGDSLANPEVGDVLIGERGPNTWRTPMFYSDIWFGRVRARYMDGILNRMRQETEDPAEVKPEKTGKARAAKAKPPKMKPEAPKMEKKGAEENGNHGWIQISFFD